MKKWIGLFMITAFFLVSTSGCAALQRKFARKKKKEDRVAPVITMHDYSKELRVDELYKKHFLYWKSWQGELIERLDATYKKRVSCYDFTLSSIKEMKKYLKDPYASELDKYIARLESLNGLIRKRYLTPSERYRIRHILESTKRQIDKRFSYGNVKDFLELRKSASGGEVSGISH